MQQSSPLFNVLNGGEVSRVVRQLSLSMNLVSEDMAEDEQDHNADEW